MDSGNIQFLESSIHNRLNGKTDQELFGTGTRTRIKAKGRPRVNRELAFALIEKVIEGKYKPRYVRQVLKIKPRTYRKLKKEFREQEIISKAIIDYDELDKALRDFDQECELVEGIRFSDWIQTKRKNWKTVFNYIEKTWSKLWDKPNLFLIKDRKSNLAGQIVTQFLNDEKVKAHSRRYKEAIKPLFIFLHREDICKRDLSVSSQRDKREIRYVPEISFQDFPLKFERAKAYFTEVYGEVGELLIELKVITKLRTGSAKDNRELFGIKVKQTAKSYLIMNNVDEMSFKVSAKDSITWSIQWMPRSIREKLFAYYQTLEKGAYLFTKDRNMIKIWRESCEKAGLPPLSFHDLRKVGITWLYVLGIPLEIGTDINVGWKDLNTAKQNYLSFRRAITKDLRKVYVENIPEWFKEGLDEYF